MCFSIHDRLLVGGFFTDTFVTFMLLILSQIVGFPLLDFFSGVSSYFQDPAPAHQAHLLIIGIGAALSILSYSVFYLSLKRRVYE